MSKAQAILNKVSEAGDLKKAETDLKKAQSLLKQAGSLLYGSNIEALVVAMQKSDDVDQANVKDFTQFRGQVEDLEGVMVKEILWLMKEAKSAKLV